ncbi:helix-turn-helix domain-containing protein [Nonomuraea sp. NN258]|uniref:helix-turn-helix domain-containing protein n=1 Tax=Nonomuraea antri TaxID=2730852 RepID=UPI0015689168|nr:helix-turn-helix transcriptional regulator [Nonomuraea antri]NRQ31901.1 helix-turn-helix domain-containing protein [Nonomuraea antri]
MPEGTRRDQQSLGALLRRWRERALLTQEDVAARSGLSVRTVRRLEGDGLPRARSTSLRLLGEALGLDRAERARMAAMARGTTQVTERDWPGPHPQAPAPVAASQAEGSARTRTRDGLVRAHDALGQAEHACRNGRAALSVLIADSLTPTHEELPGEVS